MLMFIFPNDTINSQKGECLMGYRKNTAIMLILVFTIFLLSGCSSEQNAVFQAALKTNEINSMQEYDVVVLNLDAEGLSPAYQTDFLSIKEYLNYATFIADTKFIRNADQTLTKTQTDARLSAQGKNFNFSYWVDSDISGNQPKITEIYKIPSDFMATMSPQFAGKEYIVNKPLDIIGSQAAGIDQYADMMKATKDLQEKYINFLKKYAVQYSPNVNMITYEPQTIQTKEGQKSGVWYEARLNDYEFKNLIRYTVNNFTKNEDAIAFMKEMILASIDISQIPEKETAKLELNETFKSYNDNSEEFLYRFNCFMDKIEHTAILGEKGIKLDYFISDGYIVKQTGYIDLNFDIAALANLSASLNNSMEEVPVDVRGIIKVGIYFSSDIYNIDKPVEIQIPDTNEKNSVDYMKLLN